MPRECLSWLVTSFLCEFEFWSCPTSRCPTSSSPVLLSCAARLRRPTSSCLMAGFRLPRLTCPTKWVASVHVEGEVRHLVARLAGASFLSDRTVRFLLEGRVEISVVSSR